ncbi:MAG: radical SAM protein [Methanobacteriota archaeon]|nr:MAG: radical SAM protein [Euryarchaeota archaeon]
MRVTILDGYVDEPSCLGVPPYISPYPRYIAGAVEESGHKYDYLTIDEYRKGKRIEGDLLVLIAGALVPGKYLRGMPVSGREIASVGEGFDGTKVLGGPLVRFGFHDRGLEKVFDHLAKKDLDACVHDFLESGQFSNRDRESEEWTSWAVEGAKVTRNHPDFPQPLIAEIDMSRGCARYFTGGCSFCIEPMYGEPYFRDKEDVIQEIGALGEIGVTNFRLGGQACLFSYHASGIGETETPEPNPVYIEDLLKGIRKAVTDLRVLHTDNADPSVIAAHPDKATEVLKLLVKHCTSGNVLSLGMESADPNVIEKNNLNAKPEEVMNAIKIVNTIGGKRGPSGLPYILPGINFISGLKGETKETFQLNHQFLKYVLDAGLLLRRINVRQVLEVRGSFPVRKHYKEFRAFKKKVREEIDNQMLRRVVPKKTVLKDVFLELKKGKNTFGRQIGSYPILVGIPYEKDLDEFVDVIVLDHGYRSITGIEHPLDVNEASLAAVSSIPGIGFKRAARIVRARPVRTKGGFISSLDDEKVAKQALDYLKIG